MSSLNFSQVVIAGHVCEDIELKSTANGISVASFDIAVNRKGNKEKPSVTDFFTIIAWRGLAEFVSRFFCKGSAILVIGYLQERRWEDKNGGKHRTVEIVANDIKFVDSKESRENTSENNYEEFNEILSGIPF